MQEFALAAFWANWCATYEMDRLSYLAVVRAAPHLLAELPRYFGEQAPSTLAEAGAPDIDGWQQLTLSFESFEAARERILSLGGPIEVLKPRSLRCSVADFAAQIRSVYERA
jgi:hypothetical protein